MAVGVETRVGWNLGVEEREEKRGASSYMGLGLGLGLWARGSRLWPATATCSHAGTGGLQFGSIGAFGSQTEGSLPVEMVSDSFPV